MGSYDTTTIFIGKFVIPFQYIIFFVVNLFEKTCKNCIMPLLNKYRNIFDEAAVLIFFAIWRKVNSGRHGCGEDLIAQLRQSELKLSKGVSNYRDIISKSGQISPRYKRLFFLYSYFNLFFLLPI